MRPAPPAVPLRTTFSIKFPATNQSSETTILRRLVLFASLALVVFGSVASAQTAPPQAPAQAPSKKSHSVSGSPLDSLRSTHLWAATGTPRDFVRDSRPDPRTLNYAPLTGTDPDRPKPRDAANVQALQAELERARGVNEGKARAIGPSKARRTSR